MPKLAIFYQQIIPLIPSLKKNYFNPMDFFDEIHLFTFDRTLSEEQRRAILPSLGRAKVTFHPIGGFNLHNIYFQRSSISHSVGKIRPDVLRAFSPLTDGYLATHAGKRNGIPVVVSVHGDKDRDNRHNLLREKRYAQYIASIIHRGTFEKQSLKNSTHIIAVYEFAADYARRYSASPVTVIYNKVDTDVFSPAQKKQGCPFTIINVGRFIHGKNQEFLIRAMQQIDGRLILVGKGEVLEEMKALAASLDVSDRIVWHSSLRNTELVEHFRSADVYATAIRMGGIAIPVLEAMACGLPIVQCKPPFQDMPEFIGDAGMIVENTPEGFANGLNKLKDNPDIRERMGKFAREKMLAHNSVEMDRLEIEIYRKVMAKQ